mmetsp:Transcript_4393/g.7443  ORF Transcript_4393/g.7443 Transcript_4393/m.7443 type:complete len:107 (-) Transcript_4393:777-1097(-)
MSHAMSHYPKKSLAILQNFDFRFQRILMELDQHKSKEGAYPDLICFQEVDHFEDAYKPQLSQRGFEVVTNWRRNQDAVLVGWQSSKFKLVSVRNVNYNDVAAKFKG